MRIVTGEDAMNSGINRQSKGRTGGGVKEGLLHALLNEVAVQAGWELPMGINPTNTGVHLSVIVIGGQDRLGLGTSRQIPIRHRRHQMHAHLHYAHFY